MTAFGVDEAWDRLTPAEARAAGKQFLIGYVSEDQAKNLTPALVRAYHDAGQGVLVVYEYNIHAAETGAAGGTRNAQLAVQLAKALGYPRGCAIAFAVDEQSPNLASLAAYAQAFTAVCHAAGYRSMVYGGYATVKYCLDHHLVDLGWQTYAWSNGQWDPRAVIRQVRNGVTIAGKDVDLDTAMVADYGAWMPDTTGGTDPMSAADDVAPFDNMRLEAIAQLYGTYVTAPAGWRGQAVPYVVAFKQLVTDVATIKAGVAAENAALTALAAQITAGGGSVDVAAIQAAITTAVAAVKAGVDAHFAALHKAVQAQADAIS